jgi:protein phosphatase
VREDRLLEILSASSSLQRAVDQLVDEANRMGGRDNITAILFRVGGDEQQRSEGTAEDTSEQTATDLAALPAEPAEPAGPAEPQPEPAAARAKPRRRRRRLRIAVVTVLVLIVLGGLAVGAVAAIRNVYFIGQNDHGLVTLYRGVPYELPAGIKLYDTRYVSSVQARSLRPFERRRLLDHELRSRSDAAERIRNLERGR